MMDFVVFNIVFLTIRYALRFGSENGGTILRSLDNVKNLAGDRI